DLKVLSSLAPSHRAKIVRATNRLPVAGGGVLHVRRLMLTALGGWIDVHGEWTGNDEILGWDHRTTLGRDQYVKVEEPGWLFPFGHLTSLVTITERKLRAPASDRALLWQRQYLRILVP